MRKLYFDTVVFTHHQLEYLAELYGSDHLLLGTDYPYDMALPDAVNFVTSAKLTQAEKTAILGGNAARLLKIKLPSGAAKAPAKSPPAKKRGRVKAKKKASGRRSSG